jgi:SAM-dependent methyltransferase
MTSHDGEFSDLEEENRRIWETNATWWDDQIGDGNDFQTYLIEPSTERLLNPLPGDTILDIACGAGRFARRLAARGARVIAFDQSERFITRARERTPASASVDYRIGTVSDMAALLADAARLHKAVCTMGIMDMPELSPLYAALRSVLLPGGIFVFAIAHPCFNSTRIEQFAERGDGHDGRQMIRTGVKVSSYLSAVAQRTEGIVGQPEAQWFFHRPLHMLLRHGFDAGFSLDGLEEPRLPSTSENPGVRWRDMPDIPPVLVARMRRQ